MNSRANLFKRTLTIKDLLKVFEDFDDKELERIHKTIEALLIERDIINVYNQRVNNG